MEPQSASNPALLRDGVAAAKSGDLITARSLLTQAAATSPTSEHAWLWLASVAETPGEAITCWQRVLDLNPGQEYARSGLKRLLVQEGIALARTSDKARAREMLLRAADFEPDNEIVWLWLASLAETPEEAVHYVRRVLEINPQHQRAREWLAQLQPDSRCCPVCEALLTSHAERCGTCHSVLTLAKPDWLLNNTGADQAALQTAIARDEARLAEAADFEVNYRLGLAYLNLNRVSEGLTRLQEASRFRPDDAALRADIEFLMCWPVAQKFEPVTQSIKVLPKSGQRVILVVDDSPTIRKLVAVTLERQGCRVLAASGYLDALNRLNEVVPDLILLDINMPHMDGYQLCRLIKGNEMTSKVPVVMLSGKDGFFDKARGRMVGAIDYVTKPFEPALLIQTVESNYSR
ncbi:MAG: response regulator [Blastocatellia bacterium]